MTKDYCEKCGVKLTEANRSKSYRNRCKRCVATYEKEKRQERLFPMEKRAEITLDIANFVMKEAKKFGVTVEQVQSMIRQKL